MGVVIEVVGPVFAIIALGWLAAARGFVEEAGFRGLNTFTFCLAAPALLFLGGTTGLLGGGGAALAFFLAMAALYAGTLAAATRWAAMPLGPAGVLALDATFGNTVMMGIPLITAAFGTEALAVLLAILVLHSMLLLGTATVVAEVALHAKAPIGRVFRATLLGVGRNPIVMAVLIALLWRLLALPPPVGMARRVLELLGGAGPPVALFCLGGSLAGFSARGLWRATAVAVVLKLLAMPALVWLIGLALRLPPRELAIAVVAAALPTGANAFLLAQRYRVDAARSGAAVLVGTILSVVTLSLLLGWFGGG
jgi:hypothetical protein